MKTNTLANLAATILLGGGAALGALSATVDHPQVLASGARDASKDAAPAAFNVVVTSRRTTSRHGLSERRSRTDQRNAAWTFAEAGGRAWAGAHPGSRS